MNLLFEPFSIKNLTLPNRFVRSATYDGMAEKNGRVSSIQIQMAEELARGGVGLIIWGITYVHPSGQISPVQNSLADDECIPGFRTLAETAHEHGAKIAVQLFHAGRETAKVFKPHRKQALAPSSVPDDPLFQHPYREITETEIQQVIRDFGEAALHHHRIEEHEYDRVDRGKDELDRHLRERDLPVEGFERHQPPYRKHQHENHPYDDGELHPVHLYVHLQSARQHVELLILIC